MTQPTRLMKILIVLTYYQPYTSGLTIYAVREARALASLGHQVTVLTAQYDQSLPKIANEAGVRVVRCPVLLKLSKGVLMPQLPILAWQLIGEADIVNIHVPQFDASTIALIAKMRKKPIVLTYHCDIRMPSGLTNKMAGWVSSRSHHIAAGLADVIVHNTRDFAEASQFLKTYLDKLAVIQPPVWLPKIENGYIEAFCKKFNIAKEQKIIGMVSRLATEKGVEYLVEAMPEVLTQFTESKVIFAGEYQNVVGESAYKEKIMSMIDSQGNRWQFLGVVSDQELTAFMTRCDVLVLPSINSTESFGMVQVEAMLCGTPVIASNLPGVRVPVQSTGMGKIVPPMDAHALAQAIVEVLQQEPEFSPISIENLVSHYSPETVANAYDRIFRDLAEHYG